MSDHRITQLKAENQRLQQDKAALQRGRTRLREALNVIATDIEGFLMNDWDGNEQGWKALSSRARSAITDSFNR